MHAKICWRCEYMYGVYVVLIYRYIATDTCNFACQCRQLDILEGLKKYDDQTKEKDDSTTRERSV